MEVTQMYVQVCYKTADGRDHVCSTPPSKSPEDGSRLNPESVITSGAAAIIHALEKAERLRANARRDAQCAVAR